MLSVTLLWKSMRVMKAGGLKAFSMIPRAAACCRA
jgi:hypothetical protein